LAFATSPCAKADAQRDATRKNGIRRFIVTLPR
jgi:hypothetical protein